MRCARFHGSRSSSWDEFAPSAGPCRRAPQWWARRSKAPRCERWARKRGCWYASNNRLIRSTTGSSGAGCATSGMEVQRPFHPEYHQGVIFSVDGAGGFQATSGALRQAVEADNLFNCRRRDGVGFRADAGQHTAQRTERNGNHQPEGGTVAGTVLDVDPALQRFDVLADHIHPNPAP